MPLTKVDAQLVGGAITTDSSGNVGIGTSSPSQKLAVSGDIAVGLDSSSRGIDFGPTGFTGRIQYNTNGNLEIAPRSSFATVFLSAPAGTERMRINSSGYLLVGTTASDRLAATNTQGLRLAGTVDNFLVEACSTQTPMELGLKGTTGSICNFFKDGTGTGNIAVTNTTTAYNTSSDYRLKEDVSPITGALDRVSALKPVAYKWKSDGSHGEGFIAHELQEVVAGCVTGEKDAVDAEGKPVYQGIDTSFLVATLTAAIQELKAELDATKAEVQALKAGV